MHLLNFCYAMEIRFSLPASKHSFTLRMIPHSDESQEVVSCELKVSPECRLHDGEDAFGNKYVYGEIEHEHNAFSVEVRGKVQVGKTLCTSMDPVGDIARYRYPSRYTRPGEELLRYFSEHIYGREKDHYKLAEYMLHQIYQDMEYKQGVTDVSTSAEEALTRRQGVCQDYAHIMISMCRMAGIPARYVVGMMKGEGYSHAWVEVGVEGLWHGMDPTNDRLADDTYIKISHGRDYQDCIVNRGVFQCMGEQKQSVRVIVEE